MSGTLKDLVPICAVCKNVWWEVHKCKELDDPALHTNHKTKISYSYIANWTIVKCLDCDEIIVNKWGR